MFCGVWATSWTGTKLWYQLAKRRRQNSTTLKCDSWGSPQLKGVARGKNQQRKVPSRNSSTRTASTTYVGRTALMRETRHQPWPMYRWGRKRPWGPAHTTTGQFNAWCERCWKQVRRVMHKDIVLYAEYRRLGLLCSQRNFAQSSKFIGKKNFFGTKVTSEAFFSIFQNLKVTRLQGGTWTCWRNFDLSRSFERSFGARSWLRCVPVLFLSSSRCVDGLTKNIVTQNM